MCLFALESFVKIAYIIEDKNFQEDRHPRVQIVA